MKSTTATSDAVIASLPFCTVTPPSVGLMTASLIGVLLSAAGKLPAFKTSTVSFDFVVAHRSAADHALALILVRITGAFCKHLCRG